VVGLRGGGAEVVEAEAEAVGGHEVEAVAEVLGGHQRQLLG